MNIVILGGFLGSGKTTLLLKALPAAVQRSEKETPVAILENEIGAVGVDDAVIEREGYSVSTMLSGCACCTLAGELPEAVMGITRDIDPDLLIIEATGVAVPGQMRDNLERTLGIRARICTVVDASRWRRMLTPLSVLLRQQLTDADVVAISKTDLVDEEELAFVGESLDAFNDRAVRFCVSDGAEVPQALLDELFR